MDRFIKVHSHGQQLFLDRRRIAAVKSQGKGTLFAVYVTGAGDFEVDRDDAERILVAIGAIKDLTPQP